MVLAEATRLVRSSTQEQPQKVLKICSAYSGTAMRIAPIIRSRIEVRGSVDAETLNARLVNKPIRNGKFGDFLTLEAFDLEDEDAPW